MIATSLVLAADEGGQNPLIPPTYDIIWSLVCLVIIAVVMAKLVVPTFTRILDERTEKIEGGLQAGEHAREEAERLRGEIEQELTAARVDAARIREQAQEDGKAIIAEKRSAAQVEADRVLDGARRQVEAERQQAAATLQRDVGALATTLAERIVGESLADDERRSRVIDRFLDEMEAKQPVSETTEA